MRPKLKPMDQQVIVITGASSGIGLATARLAASRGAKVVLAARNGQALEQIAGQIRADGGEAATVEADVARPEDIERIAAVALERFGRIDSWINNAATAIFGRLVHVPLADHRALFETTYWGVVNGSMTALKHMSRSGGALINVGSVISDRAFPLQGPYAAAKHAVKGFTDALRMEVKRDNMPISVTLVQPASIDTPFPDHARNYLQEAPSLPAPRYSPRLVARTILYACSHPARHLYVGGAAIGISTLSALLPRTMDKLFGAVAFDAQHSGRPPQSDSDRRDNLYEARADGAERSRYDGSGVHENSLLTEAQKLPLWPLGVAAGLAAALFAFVRAEGGWRPARRDARRAVQTLRRRSGRAVRQLTSSDSPVGRLVHAGAQLLARGSDRQYDLSDMRSRSHAGVRARGFL